MNIFGIIFAFPRLSFSLMTPPSWSQHTKCYCTWYHSLPVPPVRWQVTQQVGVTSLMSFCCSLIVFLCTSMSHPWLCLLGYEVPMGVPTLVWGNLSPMGVPLLCQGVPPSMSVSPVMSSRMALSTVTSTLFPFLSQNTSLPHMSPAPAAAFFNYIWSEVLWAPLTGCSFGVLTVVQKSAGPWGDQPQTSCSQGPCSHIDTVEI